MRIDINPFPCYKYRMEIFILQKKSMTDLKEPIRSNAYVTTAQTLGELIDEMVNKNTAKDKTAPDYLAVFDDLTATAETRFAYEKRKAKFSVADMQAFARQAFDDKIYIVKNVTSGVQYSTLDEPLELTSGDEIAIIKLKYVRGLI